MRGPEHVQAVLTGAGLDVQVVTCAESTRTAQQAAEALGTELGSIVKSLILLADGEPVLVLMAGDRRADLSKLKRMLGARRLIIPDAERVRQGTGFDVGSVPPVGHHRRLPTWIDASLGRFEVVYAAGGSPHAVFPIAFETLIRLTNGRVADVTTIP
jgi:Cys-tRNA(Pro) deacylase